MRFLLLLAILGLAALFSSCTYHGSARINSSPQGAQVYDFGSSTLLGTTPFVYTWSERGAESIPQIKEAQHVTVRVTKAGYKPRMDAFSVPLRYTSAEEALANPSMVHLVLEPQN